MFIDAWTRVPVTHRLYQISDIHALTAGFAEDKLDSAFYNIQHDEKAIVILGGDYASEFKTQDKRYHRGEDKGNKLSDPYKYVCDRIKKYKIADKIKGVHNGNHDDDHNEIPLVKDFICDPLGIPYYGYSIKITVKDCKGRRMYKIFSTHGRGKSYSAAHDPKQARLNRMLNIKRKLQRLAGDVEVMLTGHFHILDYLEPEKTLYLTDDGKKLHAKYTHSQMSVDADYIPPDLRWYGFGGSFQKTFVETLVGEPEETTFAERFMLPPNEIGYLVLNVEDRIITGFDKIVL